MVHLERIRCITAPTALIACILVFSLSEAGTASAANLKTEAVQAWNRYIQWADKKVTQEINDGSRFLIQNYLPGQERQTIQNTIEKGQVFAAPMSGVIPTGEHLAVPGGEIHHWWGTVLVPGITLPKLLAFLQDYDHHAVKFADVEQSRLLTRNDGYFKFFFRLKRKKAIVTAYYNSEQECTYTVYGPNQVFSRSTATRIAELENPGTPQERELPPGNDRGFLWRLDSWWRFRQTDKGVIVELESASLSRDIPAVIKLIPGVSSYLRATPRESLESVLLSIRANAK